MDATLLLQADIEEPGTCQVTMVDANVLLTNVKFALSMHGNTALVSGGSQPTQGLLILNQVSLAFAATVHLLCPTAFFDLLE